MHSSLITLSIIWLQVMSNTARVSSTVCQKPPQEAFASDTATAACDPKPQIYDNEGCKECMYLDTHKPPLKTIGVGLNLQTASAPNVLASVGANYSAIVNGPSTPVKTACDCSKVTCLTRDQIDKIFDISIQQATKDAQSLVSTFNSLCCPVQNVMVDMSYTLGKPTFATFTGVIGWITSQNWKASADDLHTTKWCQIQATRRCKGDADAIQKGCGCTGQLTRTCDAVSSACCKQEQTCCKGTLTFKNYITETKDEQLCCPYSDAVCCEQNKCCETQYPVCCLPRLCCAAGNRCISGQCYREDGSRGESVPAACRKNTFA